MQRIVITGGKGTARLLEDAGTRLLFDFGSNFTAEGAYFAYDLLPTPTTTTTAT